MGDGRGRQAQVSGGTIADAHRVPRMPAPLWWVPLVLTRCSPERDLSLSCCAPLHLFHSPVRCHFVQVVVLASHQNGRDTHIRQVKIFGPRK